MKLNIKITHWITGSILFEYETENNTIYKTVKEALKSGANLRGADLCGANLCGADLRGANLYGAKNIPDNVTDYWWHIHHQELVEWLTEPVRARINYIKENKPADEIELRLRLLKPVLGKIPTTQAGWKKLHKIECNCGYDFKKKTIFSKKNGLEKED